MKPILHKKAVSMAPEKRDAEAKSDAEAILEGVSLQRSYSFEEYVSLLSFPVWQHICRGFDSTRAFSKALDLCAVLLPQTEQYRDRIREERYRINCMQLIYFVLHILDKMDEWESYLSFWDQAYARYSFIIRYNRKMFMQGDRMEKAKEYIISVDKYVNIHFLWITLRRKELIKKKIRMAESRKKMGNMMHKQQEGLSSEELARRIDNFKKTFAERRRDL